MKYMKQFGIILAASFLGELLSRLIPLSIPASIYGIVFMFIGLCLHWIPWDAVQETSAFLIDILPLMFIPAAVGLMDSWQEIRTAWVQYTVITVISTIAVIAVSGLVTQAVIRQQQKSSGGKL